MLDSGEYGEVYAESDEVAYKCIKLQNADFDDTDSAIREFVVLKYLEHPNIVRLLEVELNDHHIHFYMNRHVPLYNLDIPMRDPNLVFDIVNGVKFLHKNYIAHCDVKPQNILCRLVDNQIVQLYICDFGLSRLLSGNTADVCSTGYTPPDKHISLIGADVWALGLTLIYYLFQRTIHDFLGVKHLNGTEIAKILYHNNSKLVDHVPALADLPCPVRFQIIYCLHPVLRERLKLWDITAVNDRFTDVFPPVIIRRLKYYKITPDEIPICYEWLRRQVKIYYM